MLFLRFLDARLVAASQLCGDISGLTDAAIMPFVRQFAAIDRMWFDALPLPALRNWLTGHVESDLFRVAMLPAAPWLENDTPIFLPLPDEGRQMRPCGIGTSGTGQNAIDIE